MIRFIFLYFCIISSVFAFDFDSLSDFSPFSTDKNKEIELKPPVFEPYEIPTLHGDERSFRDKPIKLNKTPFINPEQLFNSLIDCYPAKSTFKIDVSLRAAVSSSNALNFSSDTASIGRNYVQIVASMPLYSVTELNREKEREYKRRNDIASMVALFVSAIADRNFAVRSLSLYRSLEARAQIRVKKGIVGVEEQIKYLEKVSKFEKSLIKAESDILENRLQMMAVCSPDLSDRMNDYLAQISQVKIGTGTGR